MTILDEIAGKTRIRIAEQKKKLPLEEVRKQAEALRSETGFPFEQALEKSGVSFICEVKKASPSKGVIAEEFPYLQIAKEYEAAGADALSVLTEPFYFQGENAFIQEITKEVKIPVLRKDFTVDEYMIYEAKILGASAVLLICSILEQEQLKAYQDLAWELGLSALVEAHTEEEIRMALSTGARVIGVNNRDLKTFQVDIKNSIRLRKMVPQDVLYVSESGIKTAEDIRALQENHTNGVLIGETLMRSPDKKKMLDKHTVSEGDAVIALASSGVHSNGFSLVRKVFDIENGDLVSPLAELGGKSLGETLLEPTKIYVRSMLALFEKVHVKAVSHITGGGFYENIPRALPEGYAVKVDKASLKIPPIFDLIREKGNIPERDMFNTFNMGVGMSVVVADADREKAIEILKENGEDAYSIGTVIQSDEGVVIE